MRLTKARAFVSEKTSKGLPGDSSRYVKIWFQNHRYKCKRQAKEKAMAEQNAQNQVRTVPTAKNRWESRRPSKSELCPGPWQHNGLNVASRLPRKQPYSINGVESYLMGRSARASDSSAQQPPSASSPHGPHHAATSSVSHHSVVAGVSHVMSSSQSLQHCSYTRSSAQQGMQQQQQPQCGAYLPLQGRAW
ncbi:hypothetical protein G5I_10290 [Acromyrmex echinatior]|uniref:Homeobox domain-containing protein n=1 Tax=Acromyrmex echinatior TaxID=103372 RepID=F4WWH3_ACREC|nr:hypothetical protein G5I_10290 [Acromyrmex echinatior]